MSEETSADKKSTEMFTFASACFLCFVLFIGMKLRWFRARMRLDTNVLRTGSSSVATASAPTFSVTGVYRPIGSSGSTLESRLQTYTKTEQTPHHHKSMPNLSENLNAFSTESSGLEDVKTKTQSILQQNLPTSSKTGSTSNAEDYNSAAANFKLMKPKENGNIYLSTPNMLTSNNLQNEPTMKKKTAQNIVNTKLNIPETETKQKKNKTQNVVNTKLSIPETEPRKKKKATKNVESSKLNISETGATDMESGNLIFLNSSGKPISFAENDTPQKVSHKTKTKSKSKAPAPPPTFTNPKFHEYEEFDS